MITTGQGAFKIAAPLTPTISHAYAMVKSADRVFKYRSSVLPRSSLVSGASAVRSTVRLISAFAAATIPTMAHMKMTAKSVLLVVGSVIECKSFSPLKGQK
jgi:hypothetical protein